MMMLLRRHRWLLAACAALLCAVSAAAWQGWIHWASRSPEPDLTVPVTRQVQLNGASYRIDEVRVADEMPAAYGDEPTVQAPAGATFVLVILTTELLDDAIRPDDNLCEATLVDQQGRTWRTGSDLTSGLKTPEVYSCTGTSEQPIEPHRPLRVGFSFAVPADVADQVDVQLDLPTGDGYLINFSR